MRKKRGGHSPKPTKRRNRAVKNRKSPVARRLEQAIIIVLVLALPFLILQKLSPIDSPTSLAVDQTLLPTYSGPHEIVFDGRLKMDLSHYVEGDATFLATSPGGVEVNVDEQTLSVLAPQGNYEITLIVSSGGSVERIPINLTADATAIPTPIAYPFSEAEFLIKDEIGLTSNADVDVNARTVSYSYQPVGGTESLVNLISVTPFSPSSFAYIGKGPSSVVVTDIFSISNVEIGSADLVLAKHGIVDTIFKCDELDNELFVCPSWQPTSLPFLQNETHVMFSVSNFSAYGGGEAGEGVTEGEGIVPEEAAEEPISGTQAGGWSFTTAVNIAVCQNLSVKDTFDLTSDVSADGTCFNITADDVVLDCKGFTISYGDGGGDSNPGIIANNTNNITIQNCNIRDTNSGGSNGFGINLDGVNNSLIFNNTIQTNGTSGNAGIWLQNPGNNNNITNNNISTQGTSSQNFGIVLVTTVSGNTVSENTIQTKGTNSNYGILINLNSNNNTITNNTINIQGTSSNNFGIALLSTVSENTVSDNTINTNGTSDNTGIRLESSANNNTIINNTVNTNGTGANNYGIYLFTTSSGNNVTENTITTNGTVLNNGIRLESSANNNTISKNTIKTQGSLSTNIGIFLTTTNLGNTISENTITTDGTSSNQGIRLQSSSNNTVTNNTIQTNGTSLNQGILLVTAANNTINNNIVKTAGSASDNYGIYLVSTSPENTVSENTINTDGTSNNQGIRLESSANNNTFTNNNITTIGTNSYGIQIITSNNSIFNGIKLNNPVEWINSSTSTNINNNFANTTFTTENGSIQIFNNFNLTGIQDITHSKLNISQNNAFLNSTNLTFMNQSAAITLNDLTFTNPIAQVDFEDDGTFIDCNSPQCVKESFAGNTFVFNVSSFTSFQAADGVICGDITTSTNMTADLSATGTCFDITADDVVLDCKGFRIAYDVGAC